MLSAEHLFCLVQVVLRLTEEAKDVPLQKNMLSRLNVDKFMKEKKEIREKQAAAHESIAAEKLKLSAAQRKSKFYF